MVTNPRDQKFVINNNTVNRAHAGSSPSLWHSTGLPFSQARRLPTGIYSFLPNWIPGGINNLSTLPLVVTKPSSDGFNEWLAGLIDGDGSFQLSNKGYGSLEIVMEIRDKACLDLVADRLGGKVGMKQGVNFVRYRLHNKPGLLRLIDSVNGLIRNPTRIEQLSKICSII